MAEPGLTLQIREIEGIPNSSTVGLIGPLDSKTIMHFGGNMDTLLKSGAKWILLDMEGMPFVNSTGLAYLVNFFDATMQAGGALVITGLQPKVKLVMKTMGLTALLTIHDAKEAAIADLAGKAGVGAPPKPDAPPPPPPTPEKKPEPVVKAPPPPPPPPPPEPVKPAPPPPPPVPERKPEPVVKAPPPHPPEPVKPAPAPPPPPVPERKPEPVMLAPPPPPPPVAANRPEPLSPFDAVAPPSLPAPEPLPEVPRTAASAIWAVICFFVLLAGLGTLLHFLYVAR